MNPVRISYVHDGCGTSSNLSLTDARRMAEDPRFYIGLKCVRCKEHFPIEEFTWLGTDERVGSE